MSAAPAARPGDSGSRVVTILFTDIEGSSRLEQEVGTGAYSRLRARHRELIRSAIRSHDGHERGTEGDSFFVVFDRPWDAVVAAIEVQRALAAEPWPDGIAVHVRMGIHVGEVFSVDDDFVGIDINRAARIEAAAHGDQIVVSDAVRATIEDGLGEGVRLVDLGTHRMKDFDPMRLHQVVAGGLISEFPPLRSLESRLDTLPAQLTTFLGRDREVGEIRELLGTARLVTLTGPGGTGKTRLAIAAASAASDDLRDGVAWVPLASIADPDLVPSAVAKGLAVRDEGRGELLDSIAQRIGPSELLLVLDNFEQIVDAAPFVAALLGRCPGLRILVTSRHVLRLAGEREYPVEPLAVPDPLHLPALEELARGDAVALFVERAKAVRPDFELTAENARSIAAICARLDGLPLAIELAAARIGILTPAAIAARLDRSLGLLGGGARDLPLRQQTLRGAIAWSFDLLDPLEATYARRLAVFAGGWTIEDAETLSDPDRSLHLDVLDALGSLVDKSLIRRVEGPAEETRFRMLSVIREYGQEILEATGELAEMRNRHLDFVANLAERAEGELVGVHGREWLDRLDAEHDNIRAALRWALESGRLETGLVTAGRLWRFWHQRGYLGEGLAMTRGLLAGPGAEKPTFGRLKALNGAGGLAYWQNDFAAASALYEESLALSEQLGNRGAIAEAHYNLGFMAAIPHDYPAALANYEEALAIWRELGDNVGATSVLLGLSLVLYLKGDYAEADRVAVESIEQARRIGDRYREASGLGVRDRIMMETGRLDEAREMARDGLRMFVEAGDPTGMAMHLDDLSELALLQGDPGRTLRLAGAAAAFRERVAGGAPNELVRRRDVVTEARQLLHAADASAAWAAGRAMDESAAVAYALERPAGSGPDGA